MKTPEDFALCTVVEQGKVFDPLGWVVVDKSIEQVASVHVYYSRPEAEEKLKEHQEGAKMAAYWPNFEDPDVIALANSKEFHPRPQENVEMADDPMYRRLEAARSIARIRAGLDN